MKQPTMLYRYKNKLIYRYIIIYWNLLFNNNSVHTRWFLQAEEKTYMKFKISITWCRGNSTIHILIPKRQRIKVVAKRTTTKIPPKENPWEAAPFFWGAGARAGGRGDTDDGDGAAAGVKEETLGDDAGDSATAVRMNIATKSIIMQVRDILKTRERNKE